VSSKLPSVKTWKEADIADSSFTDELQKPRFIYQIYAV
jgi:hypothetical protein